MALIWLEPVFPPKVREKNQCGILCSCYRRRKNRDNQYAPKNDYQ